MTPDLTFDLIRIALTVAAPALVLAAGLKRIPQRKLARVAAVVRGRGQRVDDRR